MPTLTDAAVVCGYLGAEVPLAGTLALDEGLARSALLRVSEPLGMSPEQVARGALRIAATKMVGAIRAITVELGYRPADFGLLAFGGAGGLLACEVARDLQIGTVIVPPGPGSFSAFGMLMADVRYDFAQTTVSRLELVDLARLEDQFREMETQASSAAEHDGFGGSDCVFEWAADVRYEGQEHSVTVPLPRYGGAAIISGLPGSFAAAHEQRYGHALDDPVEVVTLRLSALVPVTRPELAVALGNAPATSAGSSQRAVFVDQGSWSNYVVMLRPDMAVGAEVRGPAVISEHTGTVVLHEGDAGVVGPHGELVIRVGE